MRRLVCIIVLLLLASTALGSGWNDFEQQLGNGYSIFRANSQDIGLAHNRVVLTGRDPLIEFVDTPTHIFTKHIRADGSCSYYVVQRQPEKVIGPLAEAAFSANDVVASAGTLKWQQPTNPHPEVARQGQFMFLTFTVVLFGAPLLLIALIAGLLVWRSRRNPQL